MNNSNVTNQLDKESSLYLRQHAENPVAWQPWDESALKLARQTGKPILLSIGYSACHWCHVMAHESFEDEATARVMNELYINIKVDREERPDLDKIYQLSHQLLTGRGGGWPLTLFLDPKDQVPFFAGTYFPVQARYGMPAFKDILLRAREWFDQNPDDVKDQAGRLQEAIRSIHAPAPHSGQVNPDLLSNVVEQIKSRLDRRHGGFGGGPKFPQAPLLELLADITTSKIDGAEDVGHCLDITLAKMAASGLRDHLDGGFFRYCVDESWTIPHFEKMLYDNAQLLPLYAGAAARTRRESMARSAEGIVHWLNAEMRQNNGAYSASIDADADGEEGGFHVWTDEQVRALLPEKDYRDFAEAYGLNGPPNFEGKAWHLIGKVESDRDSSSLVDARRTLHKERETRVHPTLDEKQLTSWNALVASGLLSAGRSLDQPEWISQAQQTIDFIRQQQWDGTRLLAVHNQGVSRFFGYLDDYAFTLAALLESLKSEWRNSDYDFALQIADAMLDHFEDQENGGLYFSDEEQPTPIARSVAIQDDATPAAFPLAIMALSDLAALSGESRLLEAAESSLKRASAGIERGALAFASALRAVIRSERPHSQLIISGSDTEQCKSLKQWVDSQFPVNCYFVRSGGVALPGILAGFESDQEVTAWLCQGMTCLPPVHSKSELQALLEQQE